MQEVQFAKVHMFPYSERPRTRAALYTNKVPHDVIQARKAKVLALSEQIAFDLRAKYVGRTMEVLTESQEDGHTANFLRVLLPGANIEPNQLVVVELTANSPEGLIGKVVSR